MPGMKTVGTNTADKIMAMATTGPETSSIALKAASLGVMPFLDVALDGLDDDDGVIHHQANGQHQAEKGEGVDGKAKDRERG